MVTIDKNYLMDRLLQFQIDPIILDKYEEPHRFYHNLDHIIDLLTQAQVNGDLSDDKLFLAIIFHDICYQPNTHFNEMDSALFFKSCLPEQLLKDENLVTIIYNSIIDTVNHTPTNETSKKLCYYDLNILSAQFPELLKYENKIFKEFQFVDWKRYKISRIEVLKHLIKNTNVSINSEGLHRLMEYIENRKPNIALYPGSFNPFHRGHYNILEKAEKIFDKVIIARGVNHSKENKDIIKLPDEIFYRQQEEYKGLLTEFINHLGYEVTVIRGLRNTTDLQYELTQYRYLQDLKPDINVISIFCDKEYEHISSSSIRNIKNFTFDKHILRKYLF